MAPDRSNISFTITHMNANHQDSLAAYLQVYCHVSAREAKSARLEDISLSDLVISANGTRYTVPIDPVMGSFSESRSRLVAMHQECLARLGRSDITIKEYRRPEGIEIFLFFVFATALVAFSRRSNFLPGSLFYETVGLGAVPPLAQLFYKTQPFVLTVMAGSHVVEASLFTVKRLKRHGVPVLSLVWCAWVVSNLIEGYTVWRRFDRVSPRTANMGISRDSRHKRSATGAKRATYRKKRAFEKGRQPSNTRIGTKRIHLVRTRGGNQKFRALRLESGNFSWGSEGISRKTRVIVVAYHPSNNELVRTNTLTKSAVVQIDAAPFRQWYEAHYGQPIGRRRQQKTETTEEKKSNSVVKKQAARFAEQGKVESAVERQFESGRLYAVVSSRPGQSGRVDGYILEGEELAFYQRAIRK
ncbi:40S ribosomal protein S8-A [Aspergillus awamori]|nr:40S ribosomal protein S8-A [Aspergillus awamori]